VAQGAGLDVYRGAVATRPELRGRFVFLAAEVPDDFQDVVEGRCLLLHPGELEEILRVVEATVVRAHELEQARLSTFDLNWVSDDQPTMLLVDDEPVELMYMVRAFNDLGFAVTPAESGNAALAQLEHGDFDVIVSDWFMVDGSGADLYAWVIVHRPELVARVVFISGAPPRDFRSKAPGRVLIPKGQDSAELVKTVVSIARRARAG
jgi:CheY-like chemotaxis protein